MTALERRWRWVGLGVLVLIVTAGCNPATSLYFLCGQDPKDEPEKRIACDKRPVKVIILTYSNVEWRPELLNSDRELANLVAKMLESQCKQNKERVTVVSNSKVQAYKEQHRNWKSTNPEQIAKFFDADYVLELDIDNLSLYEKDSCNEFFHGHAEVGVTLLDVNKRNEESPYQKEYVADYPRTGGPVPVGDSNPQKFRLEFMTRVATEIAWLFTSHPTEDQYMCNN